MIARLHLVTDDVVLQRPDFSDLARTLLNELDARVAIHLRTRRLSAAALYDLAANLVKSGKHPESVFINDRIDIALAAHAGGVQLTAQSMAIADARRVAGDRMILGYSAHSGAEAEFAANEGADLVFAGSIYPTASHPGAAPAGLELIRDSSLGNKPVIGIGGITAGRVAEVRQAGAYGVAVISAVWHAPDPVQAAHELAKMVYHDDRH